MLTPVEFTGHEIIKNVPLPLVPVSAVKFPWRFGDALSRARCRNRYPVRWMRRGDAFFVRCKGAEAGTVLQVRLSSIVARYQRGTGMKFTTRRFLDGVAVWRVR